MKKFIVTLVLLASICIATSAASLCGGGIKFKFTGGDMGTVTMISAGYNQTGTYMKDHKNNIRIVWNTGYSDKLIYVSDGVFAWGEITLKECDD